MKNDQNIQYFDTKVAKKTTETCGRHSLSSSPRFPYPLDSAPNYGHGTEHQAVHFKVRRLPGIALSARQYIYIYIYIYQEAARFSTECQNDSRFMN